ncbi:Protein of unknown function [Bacillus mycoides]|nr:Protein of unknown function [Bacillus mycoides]
MEEIVK